jgi:hypothetical protein
MTPSSLQAGSSRVGWKELYTSANLLAIDDVRGKCRAQRGMTIVNFCYFVCVTKRRVSFQENRCFRGYLFASVHTNSLD